MSGEDSIFAIVGGGGVESLRSKSGVVCSF